MIYIILLIQQLIASGTHIVAKNLALSLDGALIIFVRGLIACSAYAIWILIKRKSLIKIEKKDIFQLIILGLLNIPLNQYIFFMAIKLTTPPNLALAYALTPVYVLIISHFYFKERLTKFKVLGILVAIAGSVLLLLEHGLDLSSNFLIGNSLGLLASFSWALYTIMSRKFSLKYGPIYTTGLAMIWGFLLFVPIYLAVGAKGITTISGIDWAYLFYVGFITAVVGYAMWNYALSKLDASKVSVFNNLQPILTTILAVIIFGQQITYIFVLGGILVIVGVILTQKK